MCYRHVVYSQHLSSQDPSGPSGSVQVRSVVPWGYTCLCFGNHLLAWEQQDVLPGIPCTQGYK